MQYILGGNFKTSYLKMIKFDIFRKISALDPSFSLINLNPNTLKQV